MLYDVEIFLFFQCSVKVDSTDLCNLVESPLYPSGICVRDIYWNTMKVQAEQIDPNMKR